MMKYVMACMTFCCLLAGSARAQREHFVYLQTEDMAPFYIKLNGKTVSSTAFGYLILGKMKDSTYPVKVGVLGSDQVQDYGLKVDGRNAGYLIKKLGDKGWGLVDLQTQAEQVSMEWSSAIAAETARQQFLEAEQKRIADSTAAAAAMASQVQVQADSARDTAAVAAGVMAAQADTGQRVEPAKSAEAAAAVGAGAVVAAATVSADQAKKDSAAPIVAAPKTEQERYADSINAVIAAKEKELKALQALLAGGAAAAVTSGGGDTAAQQKSSVGTVAPAKPADAGGAAAAVAAGTAVAAANVISDSGSKPDSAKASPSAKPAATDTASKAPVFLDIDFSAGDSTQARDTAMVTAPVLTVAPADSLQPATDSSRAAAIPVAPVTDSVPPVKAAPDSARADSAVAAPAKVQRQPCTDILGREEVEKLMTTTAGMTDMDAMVQTYREAFRDKCVSTSNLKKICGGLVSDVSRYRVLEAAYPHTLDFYAFADLASLLKDPYYLTKFKALVQQ